MNRRATKKPRAPRDSSDAGPPRRSAIRVFGARQHNLKNIDVEIPRGVLTVITGLSGSGKSSLAFDTIYAEGQRKYVESLSAYARQFLEQLRKPDVDRIEGLCPTIAIEQRATTASPRSTVATNTEIYDFLRVLFARAGTPRCWRCDREIVRQTTSQIVDRVLSMRESSKIMVLAPVARGKRGKHLALIDSVLRRGFIRARVNGDVAMLEELPPLAANRKHDIDVVVDRLKIKPQIAPRLAESIEAATALSGGRVVITAETKPDVWTDEPFSAVLACPEHADVCVDELSPQLFSFNAPLGACDLCHGLGTTLEFDPGLVVPDPGLTLAAGAIAALRLPGKRQVALQKELIESFCSHFRVLPDVPFKNIPEPARRILMDGTNDEDVREYGASFEGVMPNLKRRWQSTDSESLKQRLHGYLDESPCARCKGMRLSNHALCVKLGELSIGDVVRLTVGDAIDFFEGLAFTGDSIVIAEPLVSEIMRRLTFMRDVGVDYLALDRPSATLSGGEWQRIRLATQIGSGLAGVCYVLDEPTIGLHTRDSRRLTEILQKMASMDNTVIVVEHDEEVIAGASHLIDIGPGAGAAGGHVLCSGTLEDLLDSDTSVTGRYLAGQLTIAVPQERRAVDWEHAVVLRGVTANNLKKINVRIPLGCFVCVTGVSGSGKSTLVNQVLLRVLKRRINRSGPKPGAYERLVGGAFIDKVIEVDQTPIGRTPRSIPATYVGVFDLIRQLYAKTREAKIRGYGPARFSFNVKGGRCEHCEGQGVKRIAMHFLPDVFVTCSSCGGKRYNRETLEIRFRGKTIADMLDLPVDQAVRFFESFAKICQRLRALKDVGLGYMTLGQSSSTLSGGEAQRVKLAAELHKSAEGQTLYLLDEPTTGLHFSDIRNLLTVLGRLVKRGHTVVVIEHNLEVIKVADWVIDLGPEGGDEGGRIVVEGTPEHVAAHATSYTGAYLKDRLAGGPLLTV